MNDNIGKMDKTIAMQTPQLFSEGYVKAFVSRTLDLGHIPTKEEFEYSEPDNLATIENTTLMALSYTAALNTQQHKQMMALVSPRIADTFRSFADHGVVLSIYEDFYSKPEYQAK